MHTSVLNFSSIAIDLGGIPIMLISICAGRWAASARLCCNIGNKMQLDERYCGKSFQKVVNKIAIFSILFIMLADQ